MVVTMVLIVFWILMGMFVYNHFPTNPGDIWQFTVIVAILSTIIVFWNETTNKNKHPIKDKIISGNNQTVKSSNGENESSIESLTVKKNEKVIYNTIQDIYLGLEKNIHQHHRCVAFLESLRYEVAIGKTNAAIEAINQGTIPILFNILLDCISLYDERVVNCLLVQNEIICDPKAKELFFTTKPITMQNLKKDKTQNDFDYYIINDVRQFVPIYMQICQQLLTKNTTDNKQEKGYTRQFQRVAFQLIFGISLLSMSNEYSPAPSKRYELISTELRNTLGSNDAVAFIHEVCFDGKSREKLVDELIMVRCGLFAITNLCKDHERNVSQLYNLNYLSLLENLLQVHGGYHRDIAKMSLSLLDNLLGDDLQVEYSVTTARYYCVNSLELPANIQRIQRQYQTAKDKDIVTLCDTVLAQLAKNWY